MNACERFERLIEEYLGEEISAEDLDLLERHSASCPQCRRIMELHRDLSRLPEGASEATEQDFEALRTAVLRRIAEAGKGRKSEPFRKRWPVQVWTRPAYALALAMGLIAVGFLLGRVWPQPRPSDEGLLLEEVMRQASLERGLEGYWDSPFTYSNVSIHPRSGGNVILSFDVTRRVEVPTALDSPLAREVLVYAMIDPSNMGSRFEAMAAAGKNMDASLKDALVFILLNDPSMPVRLKSLDILSRHTSDPAVQHALLVSLSQDPSVQIRLTALEYLAGQHVAPDVIRKAIGETPDESGRAVLHRAVELMGQS
jgi:hypothetical protein